MQVLDDVLGVDIHKEQNPILVLSPKHALNLRKSKHKRGVPNKLASAPKDTPIEVLPRKEAIDLARAAMLLKNNRDRIFGKFDARR